MVETAATVNFATINIEHGQRLTKILDSLNELKPDVVFFQEVYFQDTVRIANALGAQVTFSPLCSIETPDHCMTEWGIATAVGPRLKVTEWASYYYKNGPDSGEFVRRLGDTRPASCRSLQHIVAENRGVRYCWNNTHFTWAPNQEVTEEQVSDFGNLKRILMSIGELMLCGDFNSPRGDKIWGALARLFKDNVPSNVLTTLDPSVKPAVEKWPCVVDGVFTTSSYRCRDVGLMEPGLSDHRGITGKVTKSM